MGLGSLKCKRICGIWYNGAAHLGHSHDDAPKFLQAFLAIKEGHWARVAVKHFGRCE